MLSLKKAVELAHNKGVPKTLALASPEGVNLSIPGNREEDEYTRKIRMNNIVTIVNKVLNLIISDEFNDQMREMVLTINRRHKQLYGVLCKGLVHLLEFWYPNPKQAMD